MSISEQLSEADLLHKPLIKNSKEEKSLRDLKTIFGQ